jgi:hypothetical protein
MLKSELTELNHNGNDGIGKNISLGEALEGLDGITVVNPRLVSCPVETVGERLISCCIEGDQVPNATRYLETEGDSKRDRVCFDKLKFS